MTLLTPTKKRLTMRELKELTKRKSWISKRDRAALLKEAQKYQSSGVSEWEIRKKILPKLKRSSQDTIKRWEVPGLKKKLLGRK